MATSSNPRPGHGAKPHICVDNPRLTFLNHEGKTTPPLKAQFKRPKNYRYQNQDHVFSTSTLIITIIITIILSLLHGAILNG